MNPARIPDLPPAMDEFSTWRTVLWIVLYLAAVGGMIAFVLWRLPHRGDGDEGSGGE